LVMCNWHFQAGVSADTDEHNICQELLIN